MPDGTMLGPDPDLVADGRVEFLNDNLDEKAYEALLARTDFVILPYRRNSYHNRVSRVAIEAASRGIPLIYTVGTWNGEVAEMVGGGVVIDEGTAEAAAGAGVVIDAESAEAVARALAIGLRGRVSFRDCARAGARRVAVWHSVRRFRRLLVTGPDDPAALALSRSQVAGRLRILLKGWYGNENLGDDLLLLQILKHIPARHDLAVAGDRNGLRRILPRDRPVTITSSAKRRWDFLAALARCNCYILGGGGLFPSARGRLLDYLDLILAVILRKKVAILGIGINPHKRGLERRIWAYLAERATYLSVRDVYSGRFLRGCGSGQGEVSVLQDLCFAGPLDDREAACLRPAGRPIALLCPAGFQHGQGSLIRRERYPALVGELAAAVRVLMARGLRPLMVALSPREDLDLIRRTMRQPGLAGVGVLEYLRDFSAAEAHSLFRQAAFCLCMRFHSVVLAVQNCRNFVAISYDYKTESLLEAVDMKGAGIQFGVREGVCFGVERDLPPGRLAELVDGALPRRQEVERKLAEIAPTLQRRARRSFEALGELIGSPDCANDHGT